jgi:hypothetical protein
MWPPRADVDVTDVELLEMPMEMGLEFGAIVRLYDVDAEGQAPKDVIDEFDGCALIARIKHF